MSKFYAPIDEKWLDRPRAKRDSESDSATPKMKRQRSGKQDESSSDEDVDLLVEFQKQKQQKQESADNDNSEKDGDRQKKPSGSGQTSRPAKSILNQASSNNGKTKETTCSIPSTPEEETNATKKSSSDGPSAEPIKKKQKIAAFAQQTNLFDFFSSSGPAKPSKPMPSAAQSSTKKPQAEGKQEQNIKESTPKNSETATDTTNGVPDSMIPEVVATPRNVVWNSVQENVIVRRVTDDKPRDKVAAFDLDGTLTVWRIAGWPSRLEHYELWSSTVPAKLRALYDEGFKLVLFTNQGAIQSAHAGKKATLNKYVINWIAHLVDRPVHAVLSTRSLKTYPNSFHKPTGKMWPVAIQILNKRQPFSVKDSFFVGDSADLNDAQGGVDLRFAQAVSKEHGAGSALSFYSPTEYFGPSDAERRSQSKSAPPPPPKEALAARAALLGGYHAEEPIMLLLCGVQGSGKSTFCNLLVDTETKHWVHLSQDTINNGKPGKREKVEDESKAALQKGKSVVIDRMHLDQEQRNYFITVAKSVKAATHVVVFNPTRDIIAKRVRERKNHPGKVMGESGVHLAMKALDRLVMPTYAEGIQLITCVATPTRGARLASQYRALEKDVHMTEELPNNVRLSDSLNIPAISLGTMGIKKRIAKDVVRSIISAGITSIDTAPTYKNENMIGDALSTANDIFCIGKIPKSAVQPEHVRPELESTLEKLQRKHVDLLLLHWPCDVTLAGTMADVWKEMEKCLNDGLCKALGVCNFNANSLAMLLTNCSVRPVVNQVERHPLLAQWDLIDFCERNGVIVQAHSPLGQGKDELLANSVIEKVAADTSMSPAQVVIRWNLQHGVLVTPRCTSKAHAVELLSCKALLADHMKLLDSLDRGRRFVAPPFMYGNQDYCWGSALPR